MNLQRTTAGSWRGHRLGERTVTYTTTDAVLYALAVGARPDDLDLVFEERLRVLPTFALTLAQWAPDALGALGAFDTRTAVHGAQRLRVLAPLPPRGPLTMRAHVAEVWDKRSAAVFEVRVESDQFTAVWSLFAPGQGGFGGERGPSAPAGSPEPPDRTLEIPTSANQAALYRLLGDRHPMHIDPAAARAAGQPRPFLHGLCSLATAVLPLARGVDVHPADLLELEGRFSGPVFPGDTLHTSVWDGPPADDPPQADPSVGDPSASDPSVGDLPVGDPSRGAGYPAARTDQAGREERQLRFAAARDGRPALSAGWLRLAAGEADGSAGRGRGAAVESHPAGSDAPN